MRMLEEFWYGNIEPMEYGPFSNEEYKELLRLITKMKKSFKQHFQMNRKNCSPDTQIVFRSFRLYQSVCCSRTASVWEQE